MRLHTHARARVPSACPLLFPVATPLLIDSTPLPPRLRPPGCRREVKMFPLAVAGALVFVASVIASAQNAPQKPGPMDNLVSTPHPRNRSVQADLEVACQCRRAMRDRIHEVVPDNLDAKAS